MTELNAYADLLERAQRDLLLVQDKWKNHFGAMLQTTWEGVQEQARTGVACTTVADLVETVQQRLNERGRVGEASLFLREPREDRLVLLYSTSKDLLRGAASTKQVKDLAYFDSARRYYFYPLHDRLAAARVRESDKARKARGLTGWVAVAGHHLVVNGEYGKHGLDTLAEDRPETASACQTYGYPVWGRHISEAPSNPGKPKRYIAVPVKSSVEPSRTIGVLRYACPCTGRELADADLVLMREMAGLIGGVLGMAGAAIRASRRDLLPFHRDHLRRTYDFGGFLGFVTRSLRSSISSVYLDVGGIVGQESRLRLVEAFGIPPAASLRDRIQDYLSKDHGFTRWLFDEAPTTPTVESSVHLHSSWRGKNTSVFYGEHLRRLVNAPQGQTTEVARQYEIKIMGVPLLLEGDRVGVLKVELPDTFDDGRHYDTADQAFFAECGAALGETLGEFQRFLRCEWFGDDSVHVLINATRMAAELLRTRVVAPNEAPYFWKELSAFVRRSDVDVSEELKETLDRLPPEAREIVKASSSWLRPFGQEILTEVLAKALAEQLVR